MSAARPRWGGLSLRLRLTLLTSSLLCVALAIGAVALTLVVQGSRVAALDELAAARARTLVRLGEEDRQPETLPAVEPGEVAQVLDAGGRVVATSPNASRTLPVLGTADLARLEGDGGATRTAYDELARVAVLPANWRGTDVTVVVTVPLRDVEGVLAALRLSLMGVVPTLTLLLAAAIWLALGRALHPVDQLRRAAERAAREGGPGSLPVPRADDELGALARTLNEMLDRLEHASARQRAFVEDAAHELRSPIAALRTSVEVARAHPGAWTAGELAADLEPEVLRNLVENATRHAHARVRVTVADGGVVVEDDGDGVPPADRERVFERFVRLEDAREREAGGSGLGLAIAREIARDHGGDVVLDESGLGGLRATVRLPA